MKSAVRWNDLTLEQKIVAKADNPHLHEDELAEGNRFFGRDGQLLFWFSQLSKRAQNVARDSYLRGWLETHPEEIGKLYISDNIVGGDALFCRHGKYYCDAP